MNFKYLPEPAFLRIFDFLPFKDRFRVGRVSPSFRRISEIVNRRIKSLDLDDPMFQQLDEEQFDVVLNRCHNKLREIKFRQYFGMPSKFSDYTCPQLVNLDLGRNSITDDEFARIVTNHPNLESLKWSSLRADEDGLLSSHRVEFPPVTLSRLETLHIRMLDDAALERLIDRCPNLQNLEISLSGLSSVDILDGFFRSVPRLESLRLELNQYRILMENLEWFWRLSLTSLVVTYDNLDDDDDIEFMINDDFVYKLIESFKNVECLDLPLTNVNDDAVAALGALEHLRVAKLYVSNDEFADGSIRGLSACRRLEELYVYYIRLSYDTFVELFHGCPRLRKLYFCGLINDNNGEAFDTQIAFWTSVVFLQLTFVPHRPSITLEISGRNLSYQDGLELRSIWESTQIQRAVQHVHDTHHQHQGMEIDIRLVDMPPPVDSVVVAVAVDEMMQGGDLDVENGNQVEGDQTDGGQVDGDQGGGNQPDG